MFIVTIYIFEGGFYYETQKFISDDPCIGYVPGACIKLTLNDVLLESEGMIYKENIVMIQVDWLAEIMNSEIQENNGKITIILGDDELCITKFSSEAKLNSERYKLSNAPVHEKGEIFIPMRSVIEAFDWILVYNQTINLYTPQYWSEKTKEQ